MTREANEQRGADKESEASSDAHRAFVREIHNGLAGTYGFGGGVVLLVVVGLLVATWWFGTLWSPVPWLLAVTVGLSGLFVVRLLVYRRVDDYWRRLQGYCDQNDLSVQQLRAYYNQEETYPFFEVLFELQERRQKRLSDREEQ